MKHSHEMKDCVLLFIFKTSPVLLESLSYRFEKQFFKFDVFFSVCALLLLYWDWVKIIKKHNFSLLYGNKNGFFILLRDIFLLVLIDILHRIIAIFG